MRNLQFLSKLQWEAKPEEYFEKVVDNDLTDFIVEQTKQHDNYKVLNRCLCCKSHFFKWTPTNHNEIKKFLGLLIWKGPRITNIILSSKQHSLFSYEEESFPTNS